MSGKTKPFFTNSFSSVFFNPLHLIRSKLYTEIQDLAPRLKGKLIDLGCGTKPYQHLFTNCSEYLGLDIEESGNKDSKSLVDIYYDGRTFPFDNNSVDCFFSSETFEHIFNLDEILAEINRTLKPGGYLLASCPFFFPEHEVPYDFARYSSFGLQSLLEKHGFEITEYRKTGSFLSAMIQMTALYIYYFINRIPFVKHLLFILLITPLLLLALLIDAVFPDRIKRHDLYLNNIILAKKL